MFLSNRKQKYVKETKRITEYDIYLQNDNFFLCFAFIMSYLCTEKRTKCHIKVQRETR